MVIVLDQNARQCAVKQLKSDDNKTGLIAGTYVLDPVVYEKVQEFLQKLAKAS